MAKVMRLLISDLETPSIKYTTLMVTNFEKCNKPPNHIWSLFISYKIEITFFMMPWEKNHLCEIFNIFFKCCLYWLLFLVL